MPIPNYPLDLTAVLPSNHITGEVHVITTPQSRFFVPVGGPFFTQSMILRNNVTNALLMPNNDFKILHHHAEGSAATGKNVCAIIYITNPLIASVNLEYQCVGGVYSDTSDIIRQMIVDHPLDPDQPQLIGWEQVFGQPSQYPSSAHQHLANQFWGYGDLVASIEQLRVAVASGDNAAMAAIYRYIELMINNNNYLTADDLNGLLQTPDTFIKTHPTYNALRNRADFSDNLPVVYMTIGKVTTSDGLGMMFRWEPASMVDDDDHHVIRPTNRLVTEPGRLVSMLWAENMLRPVLDTLGRRILPNGTIETRISVTNHANGANLGTLITPGLYWIDNACGGRPNNVDNGMLYVERADANYIFQRVHGGQNAPAIPDNTENRTDYTEHVRIGVRSNVNDPLVWSEWESTLTKRRAAVNGLDTHLAEANIAGADLDTHCRTGVMWVGDTQLNRAFDWGILRVTVLNATDVIQEMYSANNRAVRYGHNGTNYTGHAWLPWIYSQQGDLAATSNFNATSQSLDACTKVGRHWFGLQNANRPFDHGMIEVVMLTGLELLQIAYSTLDQGTATRTWKDGLGWTTWAHPLDTRVSLRNGIDAHLALTNSLPYGGGGLDLDAYIGTAKYWAADPGLLNCPAVLIGSVLEVESIVDGGDCLQTLRNSAHEAKRYRYYVSPGVYAWTPWIFRANLNGDTNQTFNMQSLPSNIIESTHGINAWYLSTQFAAPLWLRLTNAGIDADLAVTNNVDGMDLNDILNPCEVYYNTTTGNRPSPYGLLKVWREGINQVYQLAHSSDNNLHYRYGSYYSSAWHWSVWSRSATAAEMTSAISAATAGVTPYEYVSINPAVGGISTVHHYVTTGARFLAIAISAPGGGGGAGGWRVGGEGGGGGAGGFGQLVVEGNLDGFFVVTTQYGDNASGPLGGQGMDSWGTAAYDNPSSVATVYTADGTTVLQMTVTAGQTGGTGHSEWAGGGVSWGGAAGASGSASVWRNPGYSRRAIVHTFMSDTANVQATAGGTNANGVLGQGGSIATGARNGDGGNPNNDGHGGQGGLHQVGSGALGSTGGYGAVRVVWH